MAIQYVDRTSTSLLTQTDLPLTVPANVVTNDVLLAFIDAAGSGSVLGTLPAGWALLKEVASPGSKTWVAKRLVASGDPGTTSNTTLTTSTGGAVKRQVQIVGYRGVSYAAITADSVDMKAESVSGTTHTSAPQNVVTANSFQVHHYQDRASLTDPFVTPPTGLATRIPPVSQGGTGQVTCATYDRGPVTAGSKAAETYTGTGSTNAAIISSVQIAPGVVAASAWTEVVPFRRT